MSSNLRQTFHNPVRIIAQYLLSVSVVAVLFDEMGMIWNSLQSTFSFAVDQF